MTDTNGSSDGPATDRHNEPVWDPSRNVLDLTTAAVKRQDDLRHMAAEFNERLRLLEAEHRRETLQVRSDFEAKINTSQTEVTKERFNSVETQFELVERQRVEQKKDTKDAVDAALAAAKEAVKEQTTASERAIAKSEAATTKQLEQQSATFSTAIKGVADLLQDTKDRVGAIENQKQGGTDTRAASLATMSAIIAVLSLLAVVIFAVLR
jgi:cobalamin biosynthesis Mg chelatase CobN